MLWLTMRRLVQAVVGVCAGAAGGECYQQGQARVGVPWHMTDASSSALHSRGRHN